MVKIFLTFILFFSSNLYSKNLYLNNSSSLQFQDSNIVSQQNKQFNLEFLNTSNAFKKTIETFYSYDDIKPNFKPYKFGKFKNEKKKNEQQEQEEKPTPSDLSSLDLDKIKKATPYIECIGDDDYFIASSGFYIDNTLILVPSIVSNSKCKDIYVIAYGGMAENPDDDRFYRAQVISETNEWNLSVLETSEIKESIELLNPNENDVKQNVKIFVSTHNEETYWHVEEVNVVNTLNQTGPLKNNNLAIT